MVTPELTGLREQYLYPSVPTCCRYIKQFHAAGHAKPKYATGNCMAEHQVLRQHLVQLALYRIVHPEGTIAEACAFLPNMDPTTAPFPPSKIVRAEHIFDFLRKALSTTCERAYWQTYLHKRDMFWLWNYPFRRADINTSDMIDMDECSSRLRIAICHLVRVYLGNVVILRGHTPREEAQPHDGNQCQSKHNMEWH
jgi:hypothetical protein